MKYPVLYGPRADGKIVARCPLVPGRVVVENTPAWIGTAYEVQEIEPTKEKK